MIRRERCPICQTVGASIFRWPFASPELARVGSHSPLLKAAVADKAFEVRHCARCELTFQTWVPGAEELPHIYTTSYGEAEILEEIARQKLHWFAHMTEEILVMRQMLKTARPVVLDYGCNWGKWSSMALAHGCEVYAVEVNPKAAAFCAARGIRIVSREALPGMHFDYINVDQVMEHLSDPIETALELAAHLAPGGYMKWSVPQAPRLTQTLREAQQRRDGAVLDARVLDALEPLIHVNLFAGGALRKLGQAAGLKAIRLPFFKWMGAGQLWNVARQFNRNLVVPRKRWLMQGNYLWFVRGETGT